MTRRTVFALTWLVAGCLDSAVAPEDGGQGWRGDEGEAAGEGEGEFPGGEDGGVDPGEAGGDGGVLPPGPGEAGGEGGDEGGGEGGGEGEGEGENPTPPTALGDPGGACHPNGTCNGDNFCDLVTETCQPAVAGGEGEGEGVGEGEGEGPTPPPACVRIQRLDRPWNVTPVGLRLKTRVLDCQGRPLPRLGPQELSVLDDATGGPFASVSPPLRPGGAYIVLALDLSEDAAVDEVVDGAVEFTAAATAGGHRVAVLAYGAPEAEEWVATFTGDPAALRRRLERLRDLPTRGPRDIYGAFLTALSAAEGEGVALEERFVVVHAAGGQMAAGDDDRRLMALGAARVTEATVIVRAAPGGDGGDDALSLASEGVDGAGTSGRLVDVPNLVDRLLSSTYVFGVCGPPPGGGEEPSLSVRARLGDSSDVRSVPYCLEGIGGDDGACDPGDVAAGLLVCAPAECARSVCDVACQHQACGEDRGIQCGRCGEGEICDEGAACVEGCVDMECGEDRGLACGLCGARQRCEDHLCRCELGWEGANCEIPSITAFHVEVFEASEAGVQWLAGQEHEGSVGQQATGLALLALLERRAGPGPAARRLGYVGLDPGERELAQRMTRYIINQLPGFREDSSVQTYQTGAGLMGLSVYLDTGGPDDVDAVQPVRRAIHLATAAIKAHQGDEGTNVGGWNYVRPERDGDLSTTQFAAAGLAAAQRFEADAAATLPRMVEFLGASVTADGGHRYRSGGNQQASHAMTAAGAWSWRLAGVSAEDDRFQTAVTWLDEHFSADRQTNWWNNSYYYYLWAASKAFLTSERPRALPPGGADLVWGDEVGGLRDPADDGHPDMPAGWYYDMAWQLVAEQEGSGAWPVRRGNGSGGQNVHADVAFSILTLSRSLGGACLPDVAPCDPRPEPEPVPEGDPNGG